MSPLGLRIPGLGGWSEDPLWASFYDWTVEHPTPGGLLWRLGIGSSLDRLYAVAAEIGELPDGSAVLDIPCGGGVALRGLGPDQRLRYVAADISPTMLERTRAVARRRGVDAQVETAVADVHDLRFADGEFDLVVSLTGLHCFPDPRRAVLELGRVTRSGGAIVGSTLVHGADPRSIPLFLAGRASGLLGPGCTRAELEDWLTDAGFDRPTIEITGAMGWFRGVRK
jgi:SAM-dependent methyltransferase